MGTSTILGADGERLYLSGYANEDLTQPGVYRQNLQGVASYAVRWEYGTELSFVLALFLGCGGESARSGGGSPAAAGGRAPSGGASGQGPLVSGGVGGSVAGAGGAGSFAAGSGGTTAVAGDGPVARGGTSSGGAGRGGTSSGAAGRGGTSSGAAGRAGSDAVIISGGAPNVPPLNLCPTEYPHGKTCTASDRDGCAYDPATRCQCLGWNGDICIDVNDLCTGVLGGAGESGAAGAAGASDSIPSDATLMLCDCDADERWSCAEYDV